MSDDAAPWLIVGLGNPGAEYAGNRHNIGSWWWTCWRSGCAGSSRRTRRGRRWWRAGSVLRGRRNRRVVLAKADVVHEPVGWPGVGVAGLLQGAAERIVAVHDELDIDYPTLRLKLGCGDNGHNGLKSMTKAMGPDYHRVRCGIGRPPGRMQVADFVLKDFSSTERKELDWFVDRSADAVECLV
ncbi:aminoacyl-tRNA hydrolase, partial [Streptomyces cirratus]